MTSANRSAHDEKVEALASQYQREGYEVFLNPGQSALPFSLGTYEPDLVARKGEGGLIVEVRTNTSQASIERFQALAQAVRRHPGWRFLLVTLDALNVPTSAQDMVGWSELTEKLEQSRALIAAGVQEPATLYLWAIFEAAMRKLAIATATPIEGLPATKLMNQLYTIGYLSVDDFTIAKQFLALRNQVAHGFGVQRDYSSLAPFFQLLARLIDEWQNEPTSDTAAPP